MNTFLLTVLCVLPIIGGFIAWLGDVLGYRIGKSRRSLFGLRPRTTARLIGVLVGAALPLIGLGVAAAGSQQVRIALLHLQELRAEARRLEEANRRLVAAEAGLRRDVATLHGKVDEARRQTREAQAVARKAQAEASRVSARLARARSQLAAAERAFQEALQQLRAARAERDRLAREVRELRETQQRLSKDLELAKQRSAQLEQERRQAEQRLAEASSALEKAKGQVAELADEAIKLRSERDSLRRDLEDLARQRNDLSREIDNLRRALEATQEHLAEQERKLQQAQQQVQDWQEYLDRLRIEFVRRLEEQRVIEDSPVTVEPGEEIVRAFVSVRQRPDQIEAALGEILVLANNVALAKGVMPDSQGRAVILVRPLPPTAAPGERPSEEDILAALASKIAKDQEVDRYVAIVRSLERHFARETQPLRVELWVTPDKIRFEEGEVLQRITFEPGTSRGEVLRRILGLRAHLRSLARDRGLLPDPKTGEYGAMAAEEIVRAVDEIARAKKPVELRLIVAKPVRTTDPVAIRLEVTRAR
ncbi:MAG: DUF3084 domain-containing protein [Armatimonadetes bacterium]|nr:DUF3084 domain-containing protein [Armatimonadota bacterium]